jgi:hypothetical protein
MVLREICPGAVLAITAEVTATSVARAMVIR